MLEIKKEYLIDNEIICGKIANDSFTFTQLGSCCNLPLNAFTAEGLQQLIDDLIIIKGLLLEE